MYEKNWKATTTVEIQIRTEKIGHGVTRDHAENKSIVISHPVEIQVCFV